MMSGWAGWYLFWLGVGVGLVGLTLSVYRKVSPRWLRWTLLVVGAFTACRYIAMALFAQAADPQSIWWARYAWFASAVGLTLPSLLVLDQLLRHPSWSPTKVLRYFSPWLAIYALVIVAGRYEVVPDRISGWRPELVGGWRLLLGVTQSLFVLGYVALCALLILKLRSRRVRLALGGLLLAHLWLGLDGILLATGGWYFRPFLFSELWSLAALGHAFDTALQRAA